MGVGGSGCTEEGGISQVSIHLNTQLPYQQIITLKRCQSKQIIHKSTPKGLIIILLKEGGKAETEAKGNAKAAQPRGTAARLSHCLPAGQGLSATLVSRQQQANGKAVTSRDLENFSSHC